MYPSLSGNGRGNLKVPPVPPSPPPSQATSNGTTPDPAAAADLVGQHAECKGQGIGETQGTVSSGPTGRLLVSSPCQPLAHVRHCDAGQPHRLASTDLDHAGPLLLPAPACLRRMCFTAASPTSLSLTKRTVYRDSGVGRVSAAGVSSLSCNVEARLLPAGSAEQTSVVGVA